MPDFQLLPVPGDPFHGQEPGADPEMQRENEQLQQAEGSLPSLAESAAATARSLRESAPAEPSLEDQIRELVNRPAEEPPPGSPEHMRAAANALQEFLDRPPPPSPQTLGQLHEMYGSSEEVPNLQGAALEDPGWLGTILRRQAARQDVMSRPPNTAEQLRSMYGPQASQPPAITLPPRYALRSGPGYWSVVNPNGAIVAQGTSQREALANAHDLSPPFREAMQQNSLSDEAISRALRDNPGASIFDIAGSPQGWQSAGGPTEETPPSYRSGTDLGKQLYQQHIAPHYGANTENFLRQYFAGLHDPERTKIQGDTNGTLSIETRLVDEDGNPLGATARSFDPATGEVHHDLLSLNQAAQNAGVAKKLLSSQMDAYQKMGNVKEVTLGANIDVGGYAWAKYGFYPTQPAWHLVRNRATQTLTDMVKRGMDPAEAEPIFKILEDRNPKAIWELSDQKQPVPPGMSRGRSGATTMGKALLLNRAWSGRLPLNDPEAMERFNAYTGRTQKPGNVQSGQPGQSQ